MSRVKKILRKLADPYVREQLLDRAGDYLLPRILARGLRGAPRLVRESLEEARRARAYERALWAGFSHSAVADLSAMLNDPHLSPASSFEVARILGYFYASSGQYDLALQHAVRMRLARPSSSRSRYQAVLESECHLALGNRTWARLALGRALDRKPKHTDLRLGFINTWTDWATSDATTDHRRLELLNEIFVERGLSPLELVDPTRGLRIDNITSVSPRRSEPGDPKITVIIPAYRASEQLSVSVTSVLAQSWSNLEILIVDDASGDGTLDVARSLAQSDDRIRVIERSENRGSYACRNVALAAATGQLITVHDSDDWSHPRKLETQAVHLLEHPKLVANFSEWVRVTPHLRFRPSAKYNARYMDLNSSSLMIRTDTLRELGGWDEVRVSGDAELMHRIYAKTGHKVPRISQGIPLSFGLESAASLTRTSLTHVNTIHHGVRRVYLEAAKHWYSVSDGNLVPRGADGSRAFPAPFLIRSRPEPTPDLDILFLSDLGMVGGAYVSTQNYIDAAVELGLKVGLFHYRRYDLDQARPIHRHLQDLMHAGRVYRVSPGEAVRTNSVIVGYPVVLRYPIDLAPRIECNRAAIITNQMCSRLYSGGDVQYDPRVLSGYAKKLFGREPFWIPISDLVRQLMEKDGRYEPIHHKTWTPLIDAASWCERPRAWRGASSQRPVIGRHARDHYTKWLLNPTSLAAAYCANKECEVRLLGGADHAIKRLGKKKPKNWVVHKFGSLVAREFLEGLDFYVHYPHEDYIEEFGRAVLEALAAGVPAILPPVFQATFGGAALYAEPSEVWSTIERVWRSEAEWMARVEAGRAFVRENSDWSQLKRRLFDADLVPPPAAERQAG